MTKLPYWSEVATAVFDQPRPDLQLTGTGHLPSAFAVSDFAVATIGVAGVALADLCDIDPAEVTVSRRLASLWFDLTLRPDQWDIPSAWDALAGIYRAQDGWIRLHTNAPHHRLAALSVLNCGATPAAVTDAVRRWDAADLERAIVQAKGCAAQLHTPDGWARHPQGQAVQSEPLIHWDNKATGTTSVFAPGTDAPLAGLRVLDLTRVLAGPVASRFLAGFGADVLRIDPPDWNEPGVVPEVMLGKRGAGLDLTNTDDRATFECLLGSADVLLHGYRPGALEGLGLDAQHRQRLNPNLIDVSLCAYGWTGPWAGRRGFDSLVQLSTGIAATGQAQIGADRPVPLPVQALDHGTGYLMAAAVLRALKMRQTGTTLSARLSLARTATLLMTGPAAFSEQGAITLQDADFAKAPEQTFWGAAHRVAPPLTIATRTPRWAIQTGPLRRHDAVWLQ